MKTDIHPKYYPEAKVTCSCGNTFTTGSTKPEIRVEICSKCHPFYTGEMRFVDTLGRVERFKNKREKAAKTTYVKKSQRRLQKQQETEKRESEKPKSLKEMLSKKS